jgi:hypothetical protein
MFTMLTENTRRTVGTVAAVAVVAFTGLALDQGHLGALPQGTVEVGELTAVNVMQMARVTLPEVVVTGQRTQATGRAAVAMPAQPAGLPGLAAAAAEWALADDQKGHGRSASSPTVLLK